MKNKLFILSQYILPQRLLTTLCAGLANCQIRWWKNWLIRLAIKRFNIDLSIAKSADINQYTSFNNFFIRHLRDDVRSLASTDIISPVDGCISQIGDITTQGLLQAKQKYFSLSALLAHDTALTESFIDGQFATIYLSPKDYHRVHMPCQGKLIKTIYVPGKLFSVNPVTAVSVDNLFARNERLICIFETEFGLMAQILVGAMLVAGIATVWGGEKQRGNKIQTFTPSETISLAKGQEMGYFNFGSTVILLFQANQANWNTQLSATDNLVMGQSLATRS